VKSMYVVSDGYLITHTRSHLTDGTRNALTVAAKGRSMTMPRAVVGRHHTPLVEAMQTQLELASADTVMADDGSPITIGRVARMAAHTQRVVPRSQL